MEKLLITAALFALGLWIWSEYFRAIPHLEQVGVLKNFNVEVVEPHSGTYQVVDKRYYSPGQRMLHPAAPMVSSFNDLAYLSNIDVLLAPKSLSLGSLKGFDFEQDQRCFEVIAQDLSPQQLKSLIPQLLNLSVIAATDEVAAQIRHLKSKQTIQLEGDWVKVNAAKTKQPYLVGFRHKNNSQCHLFLVRDIKPL
ncbi:hypothetical protein A3K93_10770 [Acinetobacter sp. NCu2D-2]|uniref:hypothetical protein n=1 Tax=Acinetobacter sp. NCu2D-2 TaxID=1608473 RepID=UPI0007CDA705|nr:hypothetical protein [Acinetobacter sp. NCu2D-2]ANF82627.1 hypothetical protein A3K93_10770 [Acinetobacter sp. NCu2D-2]